MTWKSNMKQVLRERMLGANSQLQSYEWTTEQCQ